MQRAIVLAVNAALCTLVATGCAVQKPMQPYVKPVLEVRHGGMQADGYYQLGRFLQTQYRLEDAAEAYRKALALDPRNADAHNGLGTLHALGGRYAEAQREFAIALSLSPDNAAVLNNIGYAYLLERNSDEAASVRACRRDRTRQRTLSVQSRTRIEQPGARVRGIARCCDARHVRRRAGSPAARIACRHNGKCSGLGAPGFDRTECFRTRDSATPRGGTRARRDADLACQGPRRC